MVKEYFNQLLKVVSLRHEIVDQCRDIIEKMDENKFRVAIREVEPIYPSTNYEIKNGIQYDEHRYSKDVFKSIQKYFSISQNGGVNQGFDFELSLDFKELMELRKRLLDCRAEGRCPRR